MPSLNAKEKRKRIKDYISNLQKTFRLFAADQGVRSRCNGMLTSCSKNIDLLSNIGKSNQSFEISIDPNWIIPIENNVCGINGSTELKVGGYIRIKSGILQDQSINICLLFKPKDDISHENSYSTYAMSKDEYEVIRRFHFDYDTALIENDRPRSHMQYGGKYIDRVADEGKGNYRLMHGLKLPRIPYPPYDITLIIDLFLRQFRTPLKPIIEGNQWRRLVCESERLWLSGYYDEINNHLSSASRTTTLHERQYQHLDW